jgi:uncharacterized protein
MTPKWLLAVIVSLAIVGTAEARQGPGFDCAKAHHPLARLICNDDDLSQIDLGLNQAYDAYRDTLSPEAKKNLANDENPRDNTKTYGRGRCAKRAEFDRCCP